MKSVAGCFGGNIHRLMRRIRGGRTVVNLTEDVMPCRWRDFAMALVIGNLFQNVIK